MTTARGRFIIGAAVTVADWVNIVVTAILTIAGLYFVHSLRRQVQTKVADKRVEAYSALWEKTAVASPMATLTGGGALAPEQRRTLFESLTEWYYTGGNGMLIAGATRSIYLTAKKNLVCDAAKIIPRSLAERIGRAPNQDAARGEASVRQLSLLRTAMRADIAVYARPWGERLEEEDKEFLRACGVSLWRRPWRTAPWRRRGATESATAAGGRPPVTPRSAG